MSAAANFTDGNSARIRAHVGQARSAIREAMALPLAHPDTPEGRALHREILASLNALSELMVAAQIYHGRHPGVRDGDETL